MVKRLLLIDDDPDDKELFCEAIEAIDEKIVCYGETNSRKALEKLHSKEMASPDIIFLDVNMPVMDGWECLRLLKSNQALRDIPVIMYSTSSQTEDMEKARQLGAVSFFQKPSDFKNLIKSLEVVVNYLKEGSFQAYRPGSPLMLISP